MSFRVSAVFFRAVAVAVAAVWAASVAHGAPELDSRPYVHPELARHIAPGITIIPDPRVNYVPNIGLIEGSQAILVVDTGLGPENGRRVWDFARKLARGRLIYLTTTHFHPEHNFGAQAFSGKARILLNGLQARELADKGPGYIKLFSQFGPDVAEALQGTQITAADDTYSGERTLDLGGRKVVLRETPAHTLGDQIVWVPDAGVLFTGDLVENRFFPILPDSDSKGGRWIAVTRALSALQPKTVVPGHGAVDDIGLIQTTEGYLSRVQQEVQEGVRRGINQEQLTRDLGPRLKALHPDWDNAVFIPYEIAIFYAEATGKPIRLPPLETELKRPVT